MFLRYLHPPRPSTNELPLLIVTTTGADPSQEIEEFAARCVGKDRYKGLAMGGGQQEIALTLLRSAASSGDWLCLQNLHLVVAWLPTLEKEINQLKPHKDFRLFLTSEAHHKFPPILLQQSLKMTFESPPGIKKNMQRTYATWTPDFIAKGKPLRAQLLFVLAWFHAIMQERRNYIPQGWTKFYEFSSGDFRAGTMAMETAGDGGEIDWETIHGLMEDAIYGGRVDNPYDLRVLQTYLKKYFNSRLIGGTGSAEIATGIVVPGSTDHEEYSNAISQLGDTDQPALFGLPDNIERSLQRTISDAVIAQLRHLSAASAEGAKFDREVWRAQLGPIIEMWEKLTESSPEVKERGRTIDNFAELDPVSAFVLMEDSGAADLCAFVNSSLMAIKRVIYGSGMLTPIIQATGSALLSGMVPQVWEKKWEGPETPQVWLRAIVQKKLALSRWVTLVHKKELLDTELVLEELFNAGTFLNALRQQTARITGCAMDDLKMVSCWEASRLRNSPLPITIKGLSLQGASFGGSCLHETAPNAPEVTDVPPVSLAFIKNDEPEPYSKGEALAVPLYHSLNREKMLVEVSMPFDDEESKWVLAGTALFLGNTY